MDKKWAVIEIGSNSLKLIIAKIKNKKLNVIYSDLVVTRLLKGCVKDNMMLSSCIEDSIKTIESYINTSKAHEVSGISIFGTKVLRDSNNSAVFLKLVREKFGINIEVLTPEEEAEYGYNGALIGLKKIKNGIYLDIGGGSCEIIYFENKLIEKFYLPIGAVNLYEKFIKNDPPKNKEITSLNKEINNKISNLFTKKFEPFVKLNAIGVGGTLTALASIKNDLKTYNACKIHSQILTNKDIEAIQGNLLKMKIIDRELVYNLKKGRADIIITGAAILLNIMNHLNLNEITISDFAARHFIAWKNLMHTS